MNWGNLRIAFLNYFHPPPPACIIALHNNFNGKFSITSYTPGQERQQDAAKINVRPIQDPDDLFLTTDTSFYAYLSTLKYNSVLQNNETATKDGSLSVYCGEHNRCYLNCETEHGKLKKYSEMITNINKIYHKKSVPANITTYSYKLSPNPDSILAAACDVFFGDKKIGSIKLNPTQNFAGQLQMIKSFPLYDNMDFFYYPAVANNPAKIRSSGRSYKTEEAIRSC